MKNTSLSKEIENLNKKDFSIKEKKKKAINTNLPAVRKVALSKKRIRIILLVALFISCFTISVFIGFTVPFLLFK